MSLLRSVSYSVLVKSRLALSVDTQTCTERKAQLSLETKTSHRLNGHRVRRTGHPWYPGYAPVVVRLLAFWYY